jgi:hypothetical protein
MNSKAQNGSALFVGRRVQACDNGECEGATIMSEPQRGGPDGAWQILVLLDSRPDYLTPLGLNYVRLKPPKQPCGECHLQIGERCDICGARQPSDLAATVIAQAAQDQPPAP